MPKKKWINKRVTTRCILLIRVNVNRLNIQNSINDGLYVRYINIYNSVCVAMADNFLFVTYTIEIGESRLCSKKTNRTKIDQMQINKMQLFDD